MASLDDFRAKFPSLRSLNDYEAINRIAETHGADPKALEQEFGVTPMDEVGDVGRSISNAGHQYKGILGAGKQLVGEGLRRNNVLPGVSDYLVNSGQENIDSMRRGVVAKDTDNLDVALTKGPGGMVDWLQYNAAQQVPNLLELGAVSLGGAGAGLGLARRAGVEGLKRAAYANAGATAAQVGAAGAHAVGEVGGEAIQEKGLQNVDFGRVLPAIGAHTGLEFVGDRIALGAMKKMNPVQTFKEGGAGAVAKTFGKQYGEFIAKEAPTEAAQTVAERFGAEKDLTNDEAQRAYFNAAGAAAAGGLIPVGVGTARAHLGADANAPKDDRTKTERFMDGVADAGEAVGKFGAKAQEGAKSLIDKVSAKYDDEHLARVLADAPKYDGMADKDVVAAADADMSARVASAEQYAQKVASNAAGYNEDERTNAAQYLGSLSKGMPAEEAFILYQGQLAETQRAKDLSFGFSSGKSKANKQTTFADNRLPPHKVTDDFGNVASDPTSPAPTLVRGMSDGNTVGNGLGITKPNTDQGTGAKTTPVTADSNKAALQAKRDLDLQTWNDTLALVHKTLSNDKKSRLANTTQYESVRNDILGLGQWVKQRFQIEDEDGNMRVGVPDKFIENLGEDAPRVVKLTIDTLKEQGLIDAETSKRGEKMIKLIDAKNNANRGSLSAVVESFTPLAREELGKELPRVAKLVKEELRLLAKKGGKLNADDEATLSRWFGPNKSKLVRGFREKPQRLDEEFKNVTGEELAANPDMQEENEFSAKLAASESIYREAFDAGEEKTKTVGTFDTRQPGVKDELAGKLARDFSESNYPNTRVQEIGVVEAAEYEHADDAAGLDAALQGLREKYDGMKLADINKAVRTIQLTSLTENDKSVVKGEEFANLQPGHANNKWAVSAGKQGEFGTAAHGALIFERVTADGEEKPFYTSTSKLVGRGRQLDKNDGRTAKEASSDMLNALASGITSLFEAKMENGRYALSGRVGYRETAGGAITWLDQNEDPTEGGLPANLRLPSGATIAEFRAEGKAKELTIPQKRASILSAAGYIYYNNKEASAALKTVMKSDVVVEELTDAMAVLGLKNTDLDTVFEAAEKLRYDAKLTYEHNGVDADTSNGVTGTALDRKGEGDIKYAGKSGRAFVGPTTSEFADPEEKPGNRAPDGTVAVGAPSGKLATGKSVGVVRLSDVDPKDSLAKTPAVTKLAKDRDGNIIRNKSGQTTSVESPSSDRDFDAQPLTTKEAALTTPAAFTGRKGDAEHIAKAKALLALGVKKAATLVEGWRSAASEGLAAKLNNLRSALAAIELDPLSSEKMQKAAKLLGDVSSGKATVAQAVARYTDTQVQPAEATNALDTGTSKEAAGAGRKAGEPTTQPRDNAGTKRVVGDVSNKTGRAARVVGDGAARAELKAHAEDLMRDHAVDLSSAKNSDVVWAVVEPKDEADGGRVIAAFKDHGKAQTVAEALGANVEQNTVGSLKKEGRTGETASEPSAPVEPMNFAMKASENIWNRATTTFDEIVAGNRTSTTRGYWTNGRPKTGQLLTFKAPDGRTVTVKVKTVTDIKSVPAKDSPFAKQWSEKEGWTYETAVAKNYFKGQQVTFELVKEGRANVQSTVVKRATPEEVAAVKEELKKTLGDKVKVAFKNFVEGDLIKDEDGNVVIDPTTGKEMREAWSGKHTEKGILIAFNAMDAMGVGRHEAVHRLFQWINESGSKSVKEVLQNAATNPAIQNQLRRLLNGDKAAIEQLKDPEEAVAYLYQFWAAGKITLGPKTETFFDSIKALFKTIIGLVTDEVRDMQHAETIMQAFNMGQLKDGTKLPALEKNLTELRAKEARGSGLVNAFNKQKQLQKYAFTAQSVLDDTKIPALLKLSRIIFTPTGAKMAEQSVMEATRQFKSQYLGKLDAIFEGVDKDDLPAILKELQSETDSRKIGDPVVRAKVEEVRAYLAKMYEYIKQRGIKRLNDVTHEWEEIPYFIQSHLVGEAITDRALRRAFLARIDLAVNVVTILTQAFLTARILQRLGVGLTLAVLPAVAALGFVALGAAPTALALGALLVVRVLYDSSRHALAKPAREVLFTRVEREQRYKSKAFIDAAVYRGGDLLSGWIYVGLAALGMTVGAIALAAAPVAVAWAVLGRRLGRDESGVEPGPD